MTLRPVIIGIFVFGIFALVGTHGVGAPAAFGQTVPEALQIVVTPTRLPTPLEQTASSLTIITGEELQRKQLRTLDQALADTPGLYIARSGAFGKSSRVFMRGAESRHVLVLMDEIGRAHV